MKKFIKDEMNIKDIMNPVDLNRALYTTDSLSLSNIIVVEYDGSSSLDLVNLPDLDYFNNEYIVLSISKTEIDGKRYIYLKQIPIFEGSETPT